MKRILIVPFVLAALSACATAPTGWRQAIDQFAYPPIDTTLPTPQWITLANGMRVALIADHELPVVSVTATLRGGALWDPPGKEGLAPLVGALLREGGTKRLSPERFDAALDEGAIDLTVAYDVDQGMATLTTLAADFPRAVGYLAEALASPRLDAARLELVR
ncbi:MAG: insulinase family protein, partial [Nitrospinae bacterium]|nr:insulinase family protein [Nitrospinota bacterium]